MNKSTKRILSVFLMMLLVASLMSTALAANDTEDEFKYEPGDNAPSEIALVYGSKTVKLSKICTWKKWKEQDTAALAEHVAEILWENDEDYQPAIDEDDVYTFTMTKPAAFAFLKSDSNYVQQGNSAEFQVVTIGYSNGTELEWKLVKDNAPVKELLESSSAVFTGKVTIKKNSGTVTVAAGLSTGKYALIVPDAGLTKSADEFSGATEFQIVNSAETYSDTGTSSTGNTSTNTPTATPAPSTSPAPTDNSSSKDIGVTVADDRGNSAGVSYNTDDKTITVGNEDISATIDTNDKSVSFNTNGLTGDTGINISVGGSTYNIPWPSFSSK